MAELAELHAHALPVPNLTCALHLQLLGVSIRKPLRLRPGTLGAASKPGFCVREVRLGPAGPS